MEQYLHNKRYPTSNSGLQCVGPCYKKNTKIIHPIYSHVVTDLHNSFCPVAEYYENNPKAKVKSAGARVVETPTPQPVAPAPKTKKSQTEE